MPRHPAKQERAPPAAAGRRAPAKYRRGCGDFQPEFRRRHRNRLGQPLSAARPQRTERRRRARESPPSARMPGVRVPVPKAPASSFSSAAFSKPAAAQVRAPPGPGGLEHCPGSGHQNRRGDNEHQVRHDRQGKRHSCLQQFPRETASGLHVTARGIASAHIHRPTAIP